MTSGCNIFNYFPENQLTNLNFDPKRPYFCPPRISVMHFASPGVPLDAPARFLLPSILLLLSSVRSPLLPLPSFLYPLHQLSIPSCLPPFLLPLSLPPILNPARRSGEHCKLPQRSGRPPNGFGAFLGWNLRNFYHWHNDKFVFLIYILLFQKMT